MYNHYLMSIIFGILLSFSCGILGSFIFWRKMASFGNTLSHSSLLGLSVALLLHSNAFVSVLLLLIVLTILIVCIEHFSKISLDTIFSIITYSSLSMGMIILNVTSKEHKADLTKYLFGNLLNVTFLDTIIISMVTMIIFITTMILWKDMVSMVISSELSQVSGINVFKMKLILMITTALLIGITTQLIGALLITSLLVISPAIVQNFVYSPETMIIYTILINIVSILLGIFITYFFNIPISPIIVLITSIFFLISLIINKN
ncbi:metal ABC transporter permease [Buchnera aphidicola]|uniref:metal ABC transporter permease n=1 Tax=Buchnera aphidicola TaxID=9 RepID=UPI003464D4C5